MRRRWVVVKRTFSQNSPHILLAAAASQRFAGMSRISVVGPCSWLELLRWGLGFVVSAHKLGRVGMGSGASHYHHTVSDRDSMFSGTSSSLLSCCISAVVLLYIQRSQRSEMTVYQLKTVSMNGTLPSRITLILVFCRPLWLLTFFSFHSQTWVMMTHHALWLVPFSTVFLVLFLSDWLKAGWKGRRTLTVRGRGGIEFNNCIWTFPGFWLKNKFKYFTCTTFECVFDISCHFNENLLIVQFFCHRAE